MTPNDRTPIANDNGEHVPTAVHHIAFVLDQSGSMQSYKQQTITGFNEYIQTLQRQNTDFRLTLIAFNECETRTVYDAVPIRAVQPLNDDTYQPDCGTPLYDSIALAVRGLDARVAGQPNASALVTIMTDGLENASKEYSRDAIFALIKEREAKGWTFAYLGANQDAYAVGGGIGIARSNSKQYAMADVAAEMEKLGAQTVSYARKKLHMAPGAAVMDFFEPEADALRTDPVEPGEDQSP
jgi:Mg-chelatase subunit ChlD